MATSNIIINSIAILRILTLASCAAALALIVTNNFKLDGDKTKFSDIKGFRYVLAAAAGGVLYSLIQLPFALYYAVKEKRLIKGDFLPMFDFYGDKVIAFLLASGVGVGFGVSIELKILIDQLVDSFDGVEEFQDKSQKFLDRGIIASGILLVGFTTMAILTIFTSANRNGRGF
ncbi:PREDICTED: CASP-like protein 4D1 [Nicotiana attenuata]|uniref:CASP-like protein n=1 Tax=Nicotiana attenuata TaxID=49451 RepID=A0A1J6JZM2_NICAT|nr:PREDICTED: CASP-like protein 4D1 [Nicotiana attenuata]OIT21892.1 casp-like protein 4d1 [Nicotiana attenuata]